MDTVLKKDDVDSSGESEVDEFEVESIEDRRITRDTIQYLVKWKNYPVEENTWEPLYNLSCSELIEEFEAKRNENGNSENVPSKEQKNIDSKTSSKKRKRSQSAMPSQSRAKKTKMVINEFEKILDMKNGQTGHVYLIDFGDSKEQEWISADLVRREHPQKVIKFYEECIDWTSE